MINFTNLTKVIMLNSVGLDTQRHSRRIRHPLTMNNVGKPTLFFYHYSISEPEIRGQDNEPSGSTVNAPVLCAVLHGALSCGLLSTYIIKLCRSFTTMIYTFLIANSGKLASLKPVRVISVIAQSEQQARIQLKGLPLVFVSRCNKGGVK